MQLRTNNKLIILFFIIGIGLITSMLWFNNYHFITENERISTISYDFEDGINPFIIRSGRAVYIVDEYLRCAGDSLISLSLTNETEFKLSFSMRLGNIGAITNIYIEDGVMNNMISLSNYVVGKGFYVKPDMYLGGKYWLDGKEYYGPWHTFEIERYLNGATPMINLTINDIFIKSVYDMGSTKTAMLTIGGNIYCEHHIDNIELQVMK
jgi:hypothetical protein